MSIWDTLSGRKSSTTSTSDHFDPTAAHDVSSFLSSTAIPDPSELHPLAGLNRETLDYLTLEDSALNELPGSQSALPSRGWTDDLSYGTGMTYLSALSIGGLWGLTEGLKKTPPSASPKLRLNSVLNSVTRRGPFLGNSAGVIAMVYNGVNSTLGYARGKHDAANSILAGALSGMLFKSTRGLRPMLISGGIVASAAAAWTVCPPNLFISPLHSIRVLTTYMNRLLDAPFSLRRPSLFADSLRASTRRDDHRHNDLIGAQKTYRHTKNGDTIITKRPI